MACSIFYIKNKKLNSDETETIDNSASNKNSQLEKVVDVLNRTEAGILKRLDENRELLELLYSDAPELMKEKPWIRRWLESQDIFLVKVAEAVNVPTKGDSIHPYPRPFPLCVSESDKEQDKN
ncbi:TPA: hypothetical protein M0F92_004583 [Salmonella enterica subsp. enterica serovar Virchow]|nr:hypothetical protein [Salmonella enterica subsp. enterica serovar Virchow]